MLPAPASRQGQPSARAGNNASGGVPKLTTQDVTFDKREARIIGVKAITGRYGSQIIVKISYNAQMFLWYLNLDNPNFESFIDALGQDENQWVDASFMLANETDDFNGKTWPTASAIKKSGTKKK
jgi:hypothetical protein